MDGEIEPIYSHLELSQIVFQRSALLLNLKGQWHVQELIFYKMDLYQSH